MKLENKTGTEFKSPEQTNGAVVSHGLPPLMSEAGKRLASATAPQSAMDSKIAGRPSNPLHDSMLPILRRP